MAFKAFVDSRGQEHLIYIQERSTSCAMACVCTLLNLICDVKKVEEGQIRQISQKFSNGFRPHPMDVKADLKTFIADLQDHKQLYFFAKTHLPDPVQLNGVDPAVIAELLAEFGLYSDKKALDDMAWINSSNFMEQLKGKIVLTGALTPRKTEHAIIIRDIWEDGTFIIFDPTHGLIETKDITKHYQFFTKHINYLAETCAYVVPNLKKQYLDLECGRRLPDDDEVMALVSKPGSRSPCSIL